MKDYFLIVEDWLEKWGLYAGLALVFSPIVWDVAMQGLRSFFELKILPLGISIQICGGLMMLASGILRKMYRK